MIERIETNVSSCISMKQNICVSKEQMASRTIYILLLFARMQISDANTTVQNHDSSAYNSVYRSIIYIVDVDVDVVFDQLIPLLRSL